MLADTAVSGVATARHGCDGGGDGGSGSGGGGGEGGGPAHGKTCTSRRLMIRFVPGSVTLTNRPCPMQGTLTGP